MLVDSHCHLDFADFEQDLDEILIRAQESKVNILQTICTKLPDFLNIRQLAEKYPQIYCSVGVHPHEVDNHSDISLAQLFELTKHPKVIGIGETGLDYYYQHSHKPRQKDFFIMHIQAAAKANLPLIIHTRNADEDTINILAEQKKKHNFTGLIHCFSSDSLDFAKECLKLGLYISLSGIITFKKAVALQNIVKEIPLERLLIETDSPYLAPEPHRGKRNEPALVKFVAQKIAELKSISYNLVAEQTTKNFFELFTKT